MSQKTFIGNSPFNPQRHMYSGSPSLQGSTKMAPKVIVPSINIQLKNQLTLNVVKNGSQSHRETKMESNLKTKKQIPISKFNNAYNSNYISGYYSNSIQQKTNSKTQTSKELNSQQELRKNNFEEKEKPVVKIAKPKSMEQAAAKVQKLCTEPTQNQSQKSLSSQNIMSLLNKIKDQPIKSKSPVTSSTMDFNFKQLLQQYQQTLETSSKRVKSSEKYDDDNHGDINGFKTDRSLQSKHYLIIQIHEADKVTEYKFDSTCGTTDQLMEYLTKQSQIVSNQQVIGFSNLDGNAALDYYLSIKDKSLQPFEKQQIRLQPIYQEKESGQLSLRSFHFLQCIGMGGFSRVYLVRSKLTGRFVALKLISKAFILEHQKQSIVQNERDVMVQLNLSDLSLPKQFICLLECSFETKNWVCFGMEYCPGGELFNQLRRVKKMTEDQARIYFVQVCIAIGFLHSQFVLYRDIKPENILINQDGHLKVADFGLARPNMASSDEAHSFCGSPEYMAPEMLQQQGHNYAVDYYCLGALLYELLTGLPPFYSKDTNQIFKSILQENVQFPQNVCSPEVRDLIRKLLSKHPEQRLGTSGGTESILTHPWFATIDVWDVLNFKIAPPFLPSLTTFNFDPSEFKKGESAFKIELQKSIQNPEENKFKPLFENFYFAGEHLRLKKPKLEKCSSRPQSSVIDFMEGAYTDRQHYSSARNQGQRRGNSALVDQLQGTYKTKMDEVQRRVQMQNSLNSFGKSSNPLDSMESYTERTQNSKNYHKFIPKQ